MGQADKNHPAFAAPEILVVTLLSTLNSFKNFREAYADPNGVVQQPMEEDALDSPWIASYVKEGEWVTFLLFSSQVTTAEEAEQLVSSLLGLGTGELVLSTKDIAAMLRQLKTVFWLVLIPCLLVIAYCVTVKTFPHRWKTFTVTKRVVAALFLCGVFPALFAGYVIAWQSLQIPDIFLPTEHFFDLSFYISKISWAMEGVDLGRLEWGRPSGESLDDSRIVFASDGIGEYTCSWNLICFGSRQQKG